MILISGTDSSLSYDLPAPVFITEERPLSTKKSRGTPKFAQPPRAPIKSCPVTRIFSRVTDNDRPQPVSFRDDSDTSFIAQSPVYRAEKSALYFEQCYIIEEKLGAGSFGEVFRVRSKEDGQLYACKRTLLKFRGEGDRRRRMEEVQKHEKLPKHRNCVEFYRAWEERQQLYLLTEVCKTSLANVAEDRHDLPESLVWEYLVDLLQGVQHLHNNNLVHMDIKPENIFFGYDGLCKLGDFGLMIDTSQGPVHEAVEGDPKYLAPEIMNLQFGPPGDIFSLGMTILELATDLDLPKQGDAWQQLRQGRLPPAANRLSEELQCVLTGFLQPNPLDRLTAQQALALPTIKKVLYQKTIKDYCRKSIMKAKSTLMKTWLYFVIFINFLTLPLKRLHKPEASPDLPNLSRANISDSDFAAGFSDDEGMDDQSLAQPISDISTSSSDVNTHRPFGNSTPIVYQFRRQTDFINSSPPNRSSINASPNPDDSPTFFRQRGAVLRSSHVFGQHLDVSGNMSMVSTPSPGIPVIEEPLPSFNLTSRNLMDMFNSVEFDEDE
ncbi:membrane-associated tyrosine- and threonine-specific cdc2-inhibitory kinase [Procambarus clarkii]|uniref:membrane-associated tyrosine- and threonine-specific cdc2-inhibitory kinase n=1 Tax=Procambarus clarkii TaxID=6728 RepID=UPI001E677262|nr:membrane-associated tyrosine- and threonine-specific cdc2-inhibitory kinase-like [Procambarus clarkii]